MKRARGRCLAIIAVAAALALVASLHRPIIDGLNYREVERFRFDTRYGQRWELDGGWFVRLAKRWRWLPGPEIKVALENRHGVVILLAAAGERRFHRSFSEAERCALRAEFPHWLSPRSRLATEPRADRLIRQEPGASGEGG